MSDLTSKTTLPIKHALVLFEFKDGDPVACAAVEFREDGHLITKGFTAVYCTHFLQAFAKVTAEALSVALVNDATPSDAPQS
jgi:hypothetical protein